MVLLFGDKDRHKDELSALGVAVQYESMKEFDEMLEDSRHVSGRDNESSERGNGGWAGTDSWEEAETLRKYGDSESMKMLKDTKAITDASFQKFVGSKSKQFNDVLGFQPIVPNAIIGLPQAMVNQKRFPKKVKTVDVFVNASTACGVDKEDMALRGAFTLSAIDALERDGYRVNLYVGKLSWDGRVVGGFINIKKAEHPMNLAKIAYYVVNPSYLRRTLFRLCENEELIPDITHSGYGSNSHFDSQKEFIRKAMGSKQLVVVDSSINISTDKSEEENVSLIYKAFKNVLEGVPDEEKPIDAIDGLPF